MTNELSLHNTDSTVLLQQLKNMYVSQKFITFCAIPWVIFTLTYYICGGSFLLLDFNEFLKAKFNKYKCQKYKYMTKEEVIKIVKYVSFQIFFIFPLGLIAYFPFLNDRIYDGEKSVFDYYSSTISPTNANNNENGGPLNAMINTFDRETLGLELLSPNLFFALNMIAELIGLTIVGEIYFYHLHRLMHVNYFYKKFHKIHHEFTYPCALEGLYFHPLEGVLNFGVVAFGPSVLGSHYKILWAYSFLSTFVVLVHHSGYWIFDEMLLHRKLVEGLVRYSTKAAGSVSGKLTRNRSDNESEKSKSPKIPGGTWKHDVHHKMFNKNFGAIGLCDWLYGTLADDKYYGDGDEKANKDK